MVRDKLKCGIGTFTDSECPVFISPLYLALNFIGEILNLQVLSEFDV